MRKKPPKVTKIGPSGSKSGPRVVVAAARYDKHGDVYADNESNWHDSEEDGRRRVPVYIAPVKTHMPPVERKKLKYVLTQYPFGAAARGALFYLGLIDGKGKVIE